MKAFSLPLIFILLTSSISFVSAQSISKTELNFASPSAGSQTININHNGMWMIDAESWVNFSHLLEYSSKTVTVNVEENPSFAEGRESVVTVDFYDADYSTIIFKKSFVVTQEASTPSLDIADTLFVPYEESTQNITVESNTEWTVTENANHIEFLPQSWATINKPAGSSTLDFHVNGSNSLYPKIDTLQVSYGYATKNVIVFQEARPEYVMFMDYKTLNNERVDTVREGNSFSSTSEYFHYYGFVFANTELQWFANVEVNSDEDWLFISVDDSDSTTGPISGTGKERYIITALTNNTPEERKGYIYLTTNGASHRVVIIQEPDYSVINGTLSQTTKIFNVYPNPSNGLINIEGTNITSVNIYNPNGELLQNFMPNQLLQVKLDPGLYLIEVIGKDGQRTTQKIIIE